MTQEEKQLLLIDLCERLPYGVRVKHKNFPDMELKLVAVFGSDTIGVVHKGIGLTPTSINECKPYLRPMSSMTEEEVKEFALLSETSIVAGKDKITCVDISIDAIDWLNAHHFDYRGLIEKGLAISVTKENNPYERF